MNYPNLIDSIAEWMAVTNTNGNLLFPQNGVQSQALSLTTSSGNSHSNNSLQNGSHAAARTIPIRCVVEAVPMVHYWNPAFAHGHVELDRRANVPVHTAFQNLVEAVLRMFGYPSEMIHMAKGSILLENWKPIRLDKVPMNPQKTVNDILGRINAYVTLRIQIPKLTPISNNLSQIKEQLLRMLTKQNFEHIISSGCPLDQMTLKHILEGNDVATLSSSSSSSSLPDEIMVRKFERWANSQSSLQTLRPVPYPSPLGHQFPYLSSSNFHYDKELASSRPDDRMHSALQSQQKTRMRTSFDQEQELPKLHKWFAENQHPDRQLIRQYVDELNSQESRRGRKPLEINNVVYWFKNARAAQKRVENKSLTGHPSMVNGYRSDSHSPCDTAITSKASVGSVQSCDEEFGEDEHYQQRLEDGGDERDAAEPERESSSPYARRSASPVAPLSLTTHKDNNNGDASRNSSPAAEVKEEPLDRVNNERIANSPASRDASVKQSPCSGGGGGVMSTSDEDEMETDEYGSETEGAPKSSADTDSMRGGAASAAAAAGVLPFGNSSPLSLIPRGSPFFSNYNFPMLNMSQYSALSLSMSRGNGEAAAAAAAACSLNSHQVVAAAAAAAAGRLGNNANNHSATAAAAACNEDRDRRGKRNRTFIDPVTEVPCLENWFQLNTHPSHALIRQYTEQLNSMSYRQKFPRLEMKNVQFWFKNRRAKCKRLKTSIYEMSSCNNNLTKEQLQFAVSLASGGDGFRSHDSRGQGIQG